MTLYKIADRLSLTINDVRIAFPETSFPDNFVGNGSVIAYEESKEPDHNQSTQKVVEVAPVDNVQQWEIVELLGDELEAAKLTHAAEIRAKRNALLSASDWMVLPDTITDKAIAYRKALRDIPSQEGFPVTVIWPEL